MSDTAIEYITEMVVVVALIAAVAYLIGVWIKH